MCSRAVTAPIARLLAATCALALALAPDVERPARGAAPQQTNPLVVILGYDHPPFMAGERIPLVRITGGHVSGPDVGCDADHYHSSPCVGPPQLVVKICGTGFQLHGPFADQNPCNCGHGVIDSFRFDVEVASVTTVADVIENNRPVLTSVVIRNNGPDYVEIVRDMVEVVEPNGNVIFRGGLFGGSALRPGETSEKSIQPTVQTSSASVQVRVSVGEFAIFGCDTRPTRVADSNPANNSRSATVNVLPADFGSLPKPVEEFVAPVKNPSDEIRVVPSPVPDTLGIATVPPGGSLVRNALLRGDGTGGFAPTPFQVDGVSGDGGQSLFGDLNADGRPDIAAPDGQNLRVALGTANGRPGRARTFPVGGVPGGVVAGDFDGDGDADLAVTLRGDPTGGISVLTGNGRDSFDVPVVTGLPGDPLAIAAADFDGDGTLDLAAALSGNPTSGPGSVAVLLGNGAGSFAQSADVAVGVRPVRVAVGDFNGDDVLDLVTANAGSDSVSIRLADGAGGFAPGVDVPVGAGPAGLAVGDLNASGTLDVAVASEGSDRLSLVLGDGAGTFFDVPVRVGAGQGSVVALDANGDGRLDLAVGSGAGANRGPDGRAALRIFLNDAEPVARPAIASVEVVGPKTLVVTGEGFEAGATILVDGVRQKTVADPSSPGARLTAKKGAKKIASGQTVVVQVETAAGVLSEWSLFTRP